VISRKFLRTFILFVFCIGLLGSLALWVGAAPLPSHNVGLPLPGANYPSGRDVQPCVGWNSFSFVFPPGKEPVVGPNVGWNSFSWAFPPQDEPQVGWNSFSFVFPPEKGPGVQPNVGWNSFS
jgi:hypothetical protein